MKLFLAGAAATLGLVIAHKKLIYAYRRRFSKVALQYFNIKGLGEPIRYVLALSGVPFEDNRFESREEFIALKPSLRFGQVPCLTIDGVEFFQSAAIMRVICKQFGSPLYPSNVNVAAEVDAYIDQIKDMDMGKMVASYKRRFGFPESVLNDDNAEEVFELWRNETLVRHLTFFDDALAHSPTMWLAGTDGPTIADVFLATMLSSYATKWPDKIPPYSAGLKKIVDTVLSLPAVTAYLAARGEFDTAVR